MHINPLKSANLNFVSEDTLTVNNPTYKKKKFLGHVKGLIGN